MVREFWAALNNGAIIEFRELAGAHDACSTVKKHIIKLSYLAGVNYPLQPAEVSVVYANTNKPALCQFI